MKAAVCYEFGKPLVVEEVAIGAPAAGQVRVKMAACAICHSDVHAIRGEWGGETPFIAGHEASGIIDEVGEGVKHVKPGDHVVVSLLRSCGHCYQCQTGAPYICAAEWPLDTNSPFRSKSGDPIAMGIRTAAFAEYTVVDQTQVAKVPNDMPLDSASLLACGVITGLGAVVNTAQVEAGSQIVVIGTGGVGLNAVQGGVLSGASRVIAVDLLDYKLEAANEFGATHTVNGSKQDAIAAVHELTDGRGADYAFVTVGNSTAVDQAFAMVRPGGQVVVVGLPEAGAKAQLDIHALISERTVKGSPMGSTVLSVDIPRLVDLYNDGRLKLDELITRRYPLAEINEAIESMERGEALRNVIVFD